MNDPSSNLPGEAAVGQGVLPALPEWAKRDDMGSLVPSQIRAELEAHARLAWNMGLNYGLQHVPAIADIGLPELRDHLKAACLSGEPITLSHLAAGALYYAMTTPPAAADPAREALQAGRVSLNEALASGELQQLKAEAHALAADGTNWSMDVGCMFVLAMIERIESAAASADANGVPADVRTKFEAWAELTQHQKAGAQHDVSGWYYFDEVTNDRWDAWQAAATNFPAVGAPTTQPAGYISPEDLPKLGQCRATLWATPQQADAVPVFRGAPAASVDRLEFLEPLYRWMARARFERPADEQAAARFAEQIKSAMLAAAPAAGSAT